MRMKTGALVLGGLLFGAAALTPAVSEGRGGGPGRWACNGRQAQCGQVDCRQNKENCTQDRQRRRDGSCGNQDCQQTARRCWGGNRCYDQQGDAGTQPKQ